MKHFRISLFAILMSSSLLFSCGGKKKTEITTTTTTTTSQTSTTTAEKPAEVEGGALNKFFPKEEGGFNVVFNQEKDGFVEASLKENGTEVATFAVSDLNANEDTKQKFASSTDKVAGYPMLPKGSKGTAILVGNRYQVQVRSKADSFDEAKRKAWLEKFDLAGLAQLK